jgi:hypothetical protein
MLLSRKIKKRNAIRQLRFLFTVTALLWQRLLEAWFHPGKPEPI